MKTNTGLLLSVLAAVLASAVPQAAQSQSGQENQSGSPLSIPLGRDQGQPQDRLMLEDFYYQTATGRNRLPKTLTANVRQGTTADLHVKMPDGRMARLSLQRHKSDSVLSLSARPGTGLIGWGFSVDCAPDE